MIAVSSSQVPPDLTPRQGPGVLFGAMGGQVLHYPAISNAAVGGDSRLLHHGAFLRITGK